MRNKKEIFDYINPYTKRAIKQFFGLIFKNPVHSIILVILIIYLSFFIATIIKALVISILIFLGGISKLYQRYTTMPIGIELVMFSTVLAGYVYGPFVGGFVGFSSFSLATFFSTRYNAIYVFVSLCIYTLAGVFSSLFNSLTIAGLVFTLIFIITLSYVSMAFLMSRIYRVIMFAFTSFLWNFWAFISLAPKIINLFS